MRIYRLERFETLVEPSEEEPMEGTRDQLARLEGTLRRITWASFVERRRRALQQRKALHALLATLA